MFGRELPTKCRYTSEKVIGSDKKAKNPGKRKVTEAQVDTIRAASFRSPCKSTTHAA